MEKFNIEIKDEYITLSQFLKLADLIMTGGEAKWYLEDNSVYVNDEREKRRGRKLYKGDHVQIDGKEYIID